MANAAAPGVFFVFAAMVLLIFVSVSEPTWDRVSFLDVTRGGSTTHYGVFGYTSTGTSIGYRFDNARMNTLILRNLNRTLILHPIAAALSGIAFLFGLCGLRANRFGTIFMTLVSGLAFLVTLVAWVLAMVLFGLARRRYREDGASAQYGNANWMTLGALVALGIGFCMSAVGSFGRYRKRSRTETY